MKVAITSTSQQLADPMDMHFGRARFFLLVDTETGRFTAHDNTPNLQARQGAGIQSAQVVARLGAQTVITGSVGPKAFRALQEAGVQIALIAEACTGAEALRRFQEGELPVLDAPNSEGHWV